jgi:hypothetical protein
MKIEVENNRVFMKIGGFEFEVKVPPTLDRATNGNGAEHTARCLTEAAEREKTE